jgi:hypothetical protein
MLAQPITLNLSILVAYQSFGLASNNFWSNVAQPVMNSKLMSPFTYLSTGKTISWICCTAITHILL